MNAITALKKRIRKQMEGPWFESVLNAYPPYLGAGVRVRVLESLGFEVSMKLRFWNQNYFGTHFGGSLYSMCDPFFVLLLARSLGPGYAVWDKSATIRFRKPGRGTVTARFEIAREEIERIRDEIASQSKIERQFSVEVRDEGGEVVAEIEKVLHLRAAAPASN